MLTLLIGFFYLILDKIRNYILLKKTNQTHIQKSIVKQHQLLHSQQ